MKRFLITSTLLCVTYLAWSQASDLLGFNQNRLQKQKTGMIVLGSWAVGNIAAGLAFRSRTSGSDHYFHTMNGAWNAVNLGIAALGYWSAARTDPATLGLFESVEEHYKFQKILLFNAGLDVGYVLGGAYLIERAKTNTKNPERLKGFGQSIILQGTFLFVFDLVNFFVHQKDGGALQQLLSGLSFDGEALGWVGRF